MAREFALSIVAPDRAVLDEPVQAVVLPGSEGYFGILAGHVPVIASLKAGFIQYTDVPGQTHYVAVSGGFVEVNAGRVSVLADTAEPAKEIDVAQAEHALERARLALQGGDATMNREQAVAEIELAMNRIKVARME
jgi:F-type H+-transporting ATPase subunit epsilon